MRVGFSRDKYCMSMLVAILYSYVLHCIQIIITAVHCVYLLYHFVYTVYMHGGVSMHMHCSTFVLLFQRQMVTYVDT